MTWVKLDDKFHSNPKLLEVGLAGAGLYARALSYCADQLTDGFVSDKAVARLAEGDTETIVLLGEHELWERVDKANRRRVTRPDDSSVDVVFKAAGYFIRDYLIFNPSRAEAEQARSEASARARAAAEARWKKNREEQGEDASSNAGSTADAMRFSNAPVPVPVENPSSGRGQDGNGNTPTKKPWQCPCCHIVAQGPRTLRDHLDLIHEVKGDELDQAIAKATQEAHQ